MIHAMLNNLCYFSNKTEYSIYTGNVKNRFSFAKYCSLKKEHTVNSIQKKIYVK
jgi:hypothetical protein